MAQKNVPQLRFPEFSGEWEEKKLGKYGYLVNGLTYSPDNIVSNGLLVLRSSNIQNSQLKFDDNVYVDLTVSEENQTRNNDILICVRNGSKRLIGKSVLIKEDMPNTTHGAFMSIFRGEHNRFISQWFQTSIFYKEVHKNLGATINSINGSDLKKFKVTFPHPDEQQKIADFLSAVDERVEKLRRKKELLEQYKKGVMQKIFSQEIRFTDDHGHPFPDWEEKKLGEVMLQRNRQTPQSENYPLMAFIANKGVAPKGDRYNREFLVRDNTSKKYKQTEIGDFIYSSNNLESGSIGLNCYGSASISPVYSIFYFKEGCNAEFFGKLLLQKSFIYTMTRYRQGVVYGQWRIHESDFLKIKQDVPCKEEQQKIADFLSAVDAKIEAVGQQLEKAGDFKKALLQQMFV